MPRPPRTGSRPRPDETRAALYARERSGWCEMTTPPGGEGGTRSFLAAVVEVSGDGDLQLVLAIDDGHGHAFPLMPAKAKKPIRFTVGQPGRRSTIWRLWAGPAKDDVYLTSRHSIEVFKFSLHQSGRWRLAAIAEDLNAVAFTALSGPEPEGRVMHRWMRPPAGATGWTEALSIWVPAQDVLDVPGDTEQGQDVQWMSPPPPGSAIEFRLFLVRPNRGPFNLTAALRGPEASLAVVNGFRLGGGEAVVLLAAYQRLDRAQQESMDQHVREHRARLPEDFDLSPASGPRALVIDVEDDGHRSFWDLSLLRTPSPSDPGAGRGRAAP